MGMLKRLTDWIDCRIGIREIVAKELTGYLLPRNINVWYSMGSILLFILGLQVVTGILLFVYYVPEADKAFKSVTFIKNDVPFGWLIRMCHTIGSSMMILILLFHMLSVLFMWVCRGRSSGLIISVPRPPGKLLCASMGSLWETSASES